VAKLAGAQDAAPYGARRHVSCSPKAVSPPPRDQGRSPLRLGAGAHRRRGVPLLAARRRSFGWRLWWPTCKVLGLFASVCCMCFGMFLNNVASVSCECCKSRSICCDVVTISDTCCVCINLDVAKVDLDVSLLQTSSFDVADACCWVLQTLNFNVADVEFHCCRHVMFGCRGGGGAPDVGCCT
jgi:hypothetical protein